MSPLAQAVKDFSLAQLTLAGAAQSHNAEAYALGLESLEFACELLEREFRLAIKEELHGPTDT